MTRKISYGTAIYYLLALLCVLVSCITRYYLVNENVGRGFGGTLYMADFLLIWAIWPAFNGLILGLMQRSRSTPLRARTILFNALLFTPFTLALLALPYLETYMPSVSGKAPDGIASDLFDYYLLIATPCFFAALAQLLFILIVQLRAYIMRRKI